MSSWAFIKHVTDQLMRPRPGDPRHPTLWPSEARGTYVNEHGETVPVGKCKRSIFYRYLISNYKFYDKYSHWKPLVEQLERERKPTDRYMQWIWAAGEQAEEYLIQKAKESGVFVAEQVNVYVPSHNISGKKDIEVYNPDTGKLTIVEAKSVYGFNANGVLGTESQRRNGVMGEPRESNLMQIALYHWWTASTDDAYEDSRLVYIARDTGRFAEYLVRTVEEDDVIHIEYKAWNPHPGTWVRVPYTINSILDSYKEQQTAIDSGHIPDREYSLRWSDEKIHQAYVRDELGKTDKATYEKHTARTQYNNWVKQVLEDLNAEDFDTDAFIERRGIEVYHYENDIPVAIIRAWDAYTLAKACDEPVEKLATAFIKSFNKLKEKPTLKKLEKSDWQCRYCNWAKTCWPEQ